MTFATKSILLLVGLSGLNLAWADDPEDDDGDGYGESSGDCDDENAAVFPGAEETCDGVDNDCDGAIDEGTDCVDDDGDGFTEQEGDCDDADVTIHPLSTETEDGVDEDCDGLIDEGTASFDDDGDGYSENEGDCDDEDANRSPGEADWCRDGVDNDCDGQIDEPCEEHPADGCDPDLTVTLSSSAFSAFVGSTIQIEGKISTTDLALDPIVEWGITDGHLSETDLSADWVLPDVPGEHSVSLWVSDECGTESEGSHTVTVLEIQDELDQAEVATSGCGGGEAWLVWLFPPGWGLRRRLTHEVRYR